MVLEFRYYMADTNILRGVWFGACLPSEPVVHVATMSATR